jgi:hypothetical protein
MSTLVPQHSQSLYRIYCENTLRDTIENILQSDKDVTGYTIFEAHGYYKGFTEKSLVIEMFEVDEFIATRIADRIRRATNQESVAIMEIPATVAMVMGKRIDGPDGTNELEYQLETANAA